MILKLKRTRKVNRLKEQELKIFPDSKCQRKKPRISISNSSPEQEIDMIIHLISHKTCTEDFNFIIQ